MSNGYYQKLLRVNLTDQRVRVESIAEDDLKKFIGGAGLAAVKGSSLLLTLTKLRGFLGAFRIYKIAVKS